MTLSDSILELFQCTFNALEKSAPLQSPKHRFPVVLARVSSQS